MHVLVEIHCQLEISRVRNQRKKINEHEKYFVAFVQGLLESLAFILLSWLHPLISHWLLMSAESNQPISDVIYRSQTIEFDLNFYIDSKRPISLFGFKSI